MTEAELQQEELALKEIHELSEYLDGIPEAILATGLFEAYPARLTALQEEVDQKSLAFLKIDKTALSVVSLYDDNSDYRPGGSEFHQLEIFEINRPDCDETYHDNKFAHF